MPPFFFIHWLKMIKSQPSKMKKKKKKNSKKILPGTFPSGSPHLSSFSPFSPLICCLALFPSQLPQLTRFPPLHSWVSRASSTADFLSSPICRLPHLCLPTSSIAHPFPTVIFVFSPFSRFSLQWLSTAGWRPRSASTGPTSSRPTSQTLSKTSPQLGGDHHRREPGQPPPSRRLDLIKEVSLKDRELRIVGEVGAKISLKDRELRIVDEVGAKISIKDYELRIVGEVGAKIRVLDFISLDVQVSYFFC